jgi:hypothetical protein
MLYAECDSWCTSWSWLLTLLEWYYNLVLVLL